MIFEHLVADLRSVLLPGRDAHPIPAMDGALTPNQRLEDAAEIGEPLAGCDDLAEDGSGALLVSAGNRVLRLSGDGLRRRDVIAEFANEVTALATSGDRLFVGLSGAGVVAWQDGREVGRLRAVAGRPLRCVTALTPLPGGGLAITEGSATSLPAQWCRDLMECNASGRLVRADAALSGGDVLADGLAWPCGVAVASDGAGLLYSEAWRHRVRALPLPSPDATPSDVAPNLPGYPARLAAADGSGFWLAVFAVRTQLVEHVLRETDYRRKMLDTIDPELWIAPSLHSSGGYLEPLQGGAIKKLGLMKPWAPPRSYGLVVRLSADGDVLDSLHSRVGGAHHGITAVRPYRGRLLAASKGAGRLLSCPLAPQR